MATKKSEAAEPESTTAAEPTAQRGHDAELERRRRAKEEATTVDGSETESVPPIGDPVEGAKARGGLGVS
jgi:hypothetical protein